MKKLKLLVLLGIFAYVHRNVIEGFLTGTEIPKAPSWHTWLPEDKRRK